MGRKPKKYLAARRKLQGFFERVSTNDLHSLRVGETLLGSRTNFSKNRKTDRMLEVAQIRRLLEKLVSKEGLPYKGRPLRLTKNMLNHLVAEFTAKHDAIEILYGNAKANKDAKRHNDRYLQCLNRALARAEAGLYAIGVFRGRLS